MDILDLLASNNYIPYNRTLARELGIEPAILFGALCGYQRHYGTQEFFREQANIIEDTCLTEYAIRQATKILQQQGLIIVKKKGLPAKNYYQINTTRLIEYLTTSGCENDTTGNCENDTTIYNKIDNKNEYKCIKRFTPPTLEEVTAYCEERQNGVDAQRFIDFYASKGWKVGNQGMKDWKACVRTWEQKNKQNFQQRNYKPEDTKSLYTNLDDVEI